MNTPMPITTITQVRHLLDGCETMLAIAADLIVQNVPDNAPELQKIKMLQLATNLQAANAKISNARTQFDVLDDYPFGGGGLTQCDMHDDESY